jgi:hypothetical protein
LGLGSPLIGNLNLNRTTSAGLALGQRTAASPTPQQITRHNVSWRLHSQRVNRHIGSKCACSHSGQMLDGRGHATCDGHKPNGGSRGSAEQQQPRLCSVRHARCQCAGCIQLRALGCTRATTEPPTSRRTLRRTLRRPLRRQRLRRTLRRPQLRQALPGALSALPRRQPFQRVQRPDLAHAGARPRALTLPC